MTPSALDSLIAPPAAPAVVRAVPSVAAPGLAAQDPADRAARAVQLACRRLERAGDWAELGCDLGRYLTTDARVRAAARAQGLLWGDRLALGGLRLLQAEQADRAARAAVRAQLDAEEQAALARAQAEQQAAQARQLAALRLLDSLRAVAEELRAAREALSGLDCCPYIPSAAARCPGEPAAAAAGVPCGYVYPQGRALRAHGAPVESRIALQLAPSGTACAPGPRLCTPWQLRKHLAPCWSRWLGGCRVPRNEPLLRYVPGGAARQPSPAMRRARLAYERERALRALERGAARWLAVETLAGEHRGRRVPVVGADLGPYLAGSRKERRRQRPLYALGYLEQQAVVVAGAPQRLTEAGAAWLRERLVEEQRREYGASGLLAA